MPPLKGIDKVRKSLQELEKKTEGGVHRALQAAILKMEDKATDLAPLDNGKLRQSFSHDVDQAELTATLSNSMPYAMFVEFGTGTYVKVPGELREQAAKFKGKKGGNFDEFLKAITAWCKRKGIDEKAAFLIAMSILKKGIKPQPFMYPAFQLGKKQFTEEIKRLVKGLNNGRR